MIGISQYVIKTHDNWYGNYPGGKVRLNYHGNIQHPDETPIYRVSAWGNDDFGMNFDTGDENKAELLFMMLSGRSFIDKKDLIFLGFSVY